MPFEDKDYTPKTGLKKQPGQKSMFDSQPKKPSPQEFQKQVDQVQEQSSGYKKRAAELFILFNKTLMDKTLPQNRSIFVVETEKEMLQNMIQLAVEINDDANEQHEGMGSLTWITCLFKACLAQRDRINELECALVNVQKSVNTFALTDLIKKEITKALDKPPATG